MADSGDVPTQKPNGIFVGVDGKDENPNIKRSSSHPQQQLTLYTVLHRLISDIFYPDPKSSNASTPVFHRIKVSVSDAIPLLPEASRNTGHDILRWARRGSPLRALLVVSAGTITLLALTGLLVFMLFFVAATTNAVIISLFVSLAAAGGFLALFFACVTGIYIGALSVAVFVISTATISTIAAVLITAGWIGFFYTVWLATTKSLGLAKHSLSMTGSALSAYSARHTHHYQQQREPTKSD